MCQNLSSLSDNSNFAARTQAWVDPEHSDRTGWWGQQQVIEVVAKDLDCFFIRAFL
jgi:hypothetical protein